MDYLLQKVSYLKGLADGLDIGEKSSEGKLIVQMIEVLEEMAEAIVEIDLFQEELDDDITVLDEDLAEVESAVFGLDDEFDYDDFDFDEFDDDDDFEFDFDDFEDGVCSCSCDFEVEDEEE